MTMKIKLVNICRAGLVLASCLISGIAFAQGEGGGGGVGGGGGGVGGGAVGGAQGNFPQGNFNFGGGRGGRGNVSTTTVTVAADEFNNALIISAPDEQMAAIKSLIAQLDRQVEENTTLRVFTLENADPQEMVSQLATLFPDPTTQARGGRGGNARLAAFTTPDGRVVRQAKVLAVADLRTSSVIVSASATMMDAVALVIHELDSNPANQTKVRTISLDDVDPAIAVQVLQSVFPSRSGIRSTTGFGTSALGRSTTGRTTTGTGAFGTGTARGIGGTTTGGTRGGGTTFGGF